jgi:hypothetical protein
LEVTHPKKSSSASLGFVFFVAAILSWEVITRSGAAYLSEGSPEKALRLRATQSDALLNLAEKKFHNIAPQTEATGNAVNEPTSASTEETRIAGKVATDILPVVPNLADRRLPGPVPQKEASGNVAVPGDKSISRQVLNKIAGPIPTEIRALAEQALVNDPFKSRAFSLLGRLAVQASDEKRAETFMRSAVRHSLFETEAVNWMMDKSYQNKKFDDALKYANILLKTRQQVIGYVAPILAGIAERQGASTDKLKKLLATNPVWRRDFFASLTGVISDARTPLVLFLSLKNTSAPPTNADLRGYLNFLVDRKLYELAYYTWLQFLPKEQLGQVGNLFNGSFEMTPSGLPFDWVWAEKPGAIEQIAASPDRDSGRALKFEFGSVRVNFPDTTELVMLAPGNYQFGGRYMSDLVTQRGLQWRVTCAGKDGGEPLGESTFVNGRSEGWQSFEFSFTVPEADCPAQYVTLVSGARSESEQFISGTIWYDDLKIVNESVIAPSDRGSQALQSKVARP